MTVTAAALSAPTCVWQYEYEAECYCKQERKTVCVPASSLPDQHMDWPPEAAQVFLWSPPIRSLPSQPLLRQYEALQTITVNQLPTD